AARRREDRRRGNPHRAHEVERPLSCAAVTGVRGTRRGGARLSAVAPADRWRGVASEEIDEFSASVAGILRRRSRRLLASLARPYRRDLARSGLLILVRSAASLALPYLVGLGIDAGIRPGRSGNLRTL